MPKIVYVFAELIAAADGMSHFNGSSSRTSSQADKEQDKISYDTKTNDGLLLSSRPTNDEKARITAYLENIKHTPKAFPKIETFFRDFTVSGYTLLDIKDGYAQFLPGIDPEIRENVRAAAQTVIRRNVMAFQQQSPSLPPRQQLTPLNQTAGALYNRPLNQTSSTSNSDQQNSRRTSVNYDSLPMQSNPLVQPTQQDLPVSVPRQQIPPTSALKPSDQRTTIDNPKKLRMWLYLSALPNFEKAIQNNYIDESLEHLKNIFEIFLKIMLAILYIWKQRSSCKSTIKINGVLSRHKINLPDAIELYTTYLKFEEFKQRWLEDALLT
ncbi:12582_t:CDS:2, partial [Dentiscutata erythropus]